MYCTRMHHIKNRQVYPYINKKKAINATPSMYVYKGYCFFVCVSNINSFYNEFHFFFLSFPGIEKNI